MDFKEILERWENSPSGRKAVDDSRFSRIIKEKEDGLHDSRHRFTKDGLNKSDFKRLVIEDSIDLHGMTGDEAIDFLRNFLAGAASRKLRKIRIVHGKGLHSQDGRAVLRDIVYRELSQSKYVRAFQKTAPADGGSGAVWVVLKFE
ncbi:MAG: Smr/MutS family protein [Sphaerochaetaceae bacterium]|jgi:DNA-nicking Smr family endonuclease|nr:Smr/MutS family protein [Sphaerochaetaceae bacterium]MDX9808777.1 Smr/MutS family protein [Sphaerochaetaceae bacterium]NLV83176.1 Smr/MutS family protein [Spirochaetales bacterium]